MTNFKLYGWIVTFAIEHVPKLSEGAVDGLAGHHVEAGVVDSVVGQGEYQQVQSNLSVVEVSKVEQNSGVHLVAHRPGRRAGQQPVQPPVPTAIHCIFSTIKTASHSLFARQHKII